MADAGRALLEEDDQPADAITTPRSDGYHAGAEAAAIERPRSPLSRIASMVDEMHTPPLHERPRSSLCEQVSCWFAATLLLGVLAVVALVAVAFPLPATTAQAAACRKSAAVAVLQTRGNATHREQQLVVWSGIGHSDYLFHDLHVFSLSNLTWAKVKEKGAGTDADAAPSQQRRAGGWLSMPSPMQQQAQLQRRADSLGRSPLPPPPMSLPRPRWKAAVAQADDLGMWLHGGYHPGKPSDSSRSSSSGAGGSRWWRRWSDNGGGGSMADDEQLDKPAAPGQFLADTWLLSFPELSWHATHANCNSSSACPSSRRSHTATSFKDEQGRHVILVFGGRRHDGVLLNDVWAGTLLSLPPTPTPAPPRQVQPSGLAALGGSLAIAWTLLHDPQAGVGEGPAPLPRSGHAAVALNSSHLVVHGGRSEVYGAFGDVWAFDTAASRWRPLRPATAVAPAPRDHHVAALAADGTRLLVVGGRVGPPSGPLRPASDRWLFSLATCTWLQLPVHGLGPLPRYLASAVVQRAPGGDQHLLMFGGETGSRCKLNDVWRFHLQLLKWEQLSPAAFATPQCRKTYD